MAHIKVFRRSMSTKQWARLQFERIDQLIEAQSVPTSGWQVRNGQYFPEGYVWDEPHHPIHANEFWGRPDGTAESIGSVEIPPELAGKKVWFQFYVGGEVIVYDSKSLEIVKRLPMSEMLLLRSRL